ncbi:hypothetical protein [Sphingopyxis lindanitolerans]|nr:hypothetical protein [Sphingopyxis lindanitolerans]
MNGASSATLPIGAKPVAEALALYCKRPSGDMVVDLLGRASVDAILKSPTIIPPLPNAPVRAALSLTALIAALAIIFLPMSGIATAVLLAVLAIVVLIAGKPWISYVRDRFMNRHEPTRADLAGLAGNAVQTRNVQSLEEFRRQIGSGALKTYSVSPSGAVKLLTGKALACFAADHGRILLVSENLNDWFQISARPLPQGAIWIDLGGAVARSRLTARTLINEPDEAHYQQRIAWIRERAIEHGQGSGALISGLAIIEAMRHPDVRGRPFTKAIPAIRAVLKGPAASDSIISKMHSGNYPEFETALHALPLEDLP